MSRDDGVQRERYDIHFQVTILEGRVDELRSHLGGRDGARYPHGDG